MFSGLGLKHHSNSGRVNSFAFLPGRSQNFFIFNVFHFGDIDGIEGNYNIVNIIRNIVLLVLIGHRRYAGSTRKRPVIHPIVKMIRRRQVGRTTGNIIGGDVTGRDTDGHVAGSSGRIEGGRDLGFVPRSGIPAGLFWTRAVWRKSSGRRSTAAAVD